MDVAGRPQRRAATGGGGGPRPRLHSRRRRLRQDDDYHPPDRTPDRERSVSPGRDPRGHVHRQGRRTASRATGGAGGARRHRSDISRCRARATAPLRPGARWQDRRVEGVATAPSRAVAARRVRVSAARRRRHRDRVGEEPPHPAGALPHRARRPRAAAPGRPHAPDLRRLRRGEAREGARRLRGSARAGDPHVRGGRASAGALPRALPGLHGRRVPGRQPAPADAPRPVARRPRRSLRRRRRLPVDLCLHRCIAGVPPGDAVAVPARDCRPARGELPLDAPGAGARQPPRTRARRRREDATRDAAGRARSRAGASAGRGRLCRRANPGARCAARGDRCPLPHKRAADRLRGCAGGRGHPASGLVVSRPGRCAVRAAEARLAG